MISRSRVHADRRRRICRERRDADSSGAGERSARRGRDSECAARAVCAACPLSVSARSSRATRYMQASILAVSRKGQELTVNADAERREQGQACRDPAAVSQGTRAAPRLDRQSRSQNGGIAPWLAGVDSPIDSRGIGYCDCGALGPRRSSPAAPAFPAGRCPADPPSVCGRGNSMARTDDGAAASSRQAPAPDRKRGNLTLRPADGRWRRDRASPCTAMRRSKGRTRARTEGSPFAVGARRRSGPDLRPCRLAPRSRSAHPG